MSTKKGDHGSNSSKRIASNSTKETEKIKTNKKPTDLDLLKKNNVSSSNAKLVKSTELLKHDKNKPRNSHSSSDKKSSLHAVKTKPEISYKKSTITKNTFKELANNKKERDPINLSNIKISQNLERKIKSDTSSSRNTSNSLKVEAKPNPSKGNSDLPKFTRSINADEAPNRILERPSTATLSRGTVINRNKIGPDNLNIVSLKSPTSKSDSSEDHDKYEDDFESYESDFEECSSSSTANLIRDISSSSSLSSSSDEPISFEKHSTNGVILSSGSEDDKTLDSGNFEMPGYKHRPMLDNIKEAIEKENTNISSPTNYASFSDEGFEDHKSFQFVNFVDAQIKNKRRKSIQMRQKRGEEILSMVRLDCCSFTLIDLSPISYEMYVRNFGASNTIQTSTQTGDDDIDEEIQTDEVESSEKGTQQPEVFISYNNVEKDSISDSKVVDKRTNKTIFNKFMLTACEVILKIQEESRKLQYNSESGPISKSIANFKTDMNIFSDSHVTNIHFPSDKNEKVISVHSKIEGSSLVAIWNISNCEEPESVILCHGVISCCSIGVYSHELIFTGLEDGAILIWSGSRNVNKDDLITTVPLFSTRINSGHHTKIIGLNFLGNPSVEERNIQQTNELCSIDETGEIILWTIMFKYSDHKDSDKNKITLVKNANISLSTLCPDMNYLHCTNFSSSIFNPYYLFISTNYSSIIHYVIKAGMNKIKQFSTEVKSVPNSLECCPFSSEYFLGGYENGNLSLFTRSSERPLIILSDKDKQNSAIEIIQWSNNKSTVIYSKDNRNNINIWDLDESDMMPIYTIPYKEEITAMKMFSASRDTENKFPFMLIGTNQGNLYLHQLNEGESQPGNQLHNQSIKMFFNYVKRL